MGLGPIVPPWRVLWAFDEDWSAGVMGFLFFKNAPWRFPLGYIPTYYEPYGTTVGFTDSAPSLAVAAKLVAPLMPNDFQYIGLYMCFSFGALAFAGERLVSRVFADPWQRLLGGMMFALSPVIAARVGHPTLCAMFVVVLALHLSLARPSSFAEAGASLIRILALMAFAAGSHPYLAVMTCVLLTAGALSHVVVDRVVPLRWSLPWAASPLCVALFFFWLYGFILFQKMDPAADGFGQFSMDLAAFVNPLGHSVFVPDQPSSPRAFEGFQYLGLGAMMLLTVGLGLLIWRAVTAAKIDFAQVQRSLGRYAILGAAVLLLAVYAMSFSVRLHGKEILDLRDLYAPVLAQASIFRSSGRFGWPMHFALMSVAVLGVSLLRNNRRGLWMGRVILVAGVGLQVADTKANTRLPRTQLVQPLPPALFQTLGDDYDRFVFVPIHLQWICRYNEPRVQQFAYEANRHHMGMNSAYVARGIAGASEMCDRHLPGTAPLDARAVYVVDDDFVRDFRREDAVCAVREHVRLCVQKRDTPFARALGSASSAPL